MRIKVDENLPLSLVEILNSFGHDTEHVVTEGLSGRDDLAVWAAAQVEERFLITQDIRFANAHMAPEPQGLPQKREPWRRRTWAGG